MATNDKPRRRICNNCNREHASVAHDNVTRVRLCDDCWVKVDPRNYNFTDPEFLTDDEKRV